MLERAVRARMAACKLTQSGEYWRLLQEAPSELEQLIEEVVVPETWFFRDREALRPTTGAVRGAAVADRPDRDGTHSCPCTAGGYQRVA